VKPRNSEDRTENAEACVTRSPIQTIEKLTRRSHVQEVESSKRHEKQPEGSRDRTGSEWAQAGQPRLVGNPFRARFDTPFDLDALKTIYSPPTKSHASIHSPSVAEEQRS
jgi:hypothetical protein